MLKLGRAPNAAAGSVSSGLAPKATVAIWLARMADSNRRTDIEFLLEHIVAERKASAPSLPRPVHALNSLVGPDHQAADQEQGMCISGRMTLGNQRASGLRQMGDPIWPEFHAVAAITFISGEDSGNPDDLRWRDGRH
jgi:hypothetical protein